MAAQITISSLSLRYAGAVLPALSSLSLEVEEGTCVGVIGPTGAGKTTLLHALSGILGKHHRDAVAEGTLMIAGRAFQDIPRDVLFPAVGLALQDPVVQLSGVCETVREEINFTLDNLGRRAPSATYLESLADGLGISRLLERNPTTLSGGETQRVALATILIAQPRILLLDEPAVSLDSNAQDRLRRILRSMKGTTTIILTDTRLDFPLAVCDQIVALEHGEVIYNGTPGSLFTDRGVPLSPEWHRWKGLSENIEIMRTNAPSRLSRIERAIGLS